MFNLQITDHSQDGPDGQTLDITIARFQRESDVQDIERMLENKFGGDNGRFSFFYYEEDDNIPINPGYVSLCDEIEKMFKLKEHNEHEARWEGSVCGSCGKNEVKNGKFISNHGINCSEYIEPEYLNVFKGKLL